MGRPGRMVYEGPTPGARHRRAPAPHGNARGAHEAVFRRRPAGTARTVPVRNLGRPGGSPLRCGARSAAASHCVGPSCATGAGRSTAMESPLPGTGRDDRRRGPSEVARRQDPPSPGAARRPLPGRERRLFVASLETGASVLSAYSTERTQSAGNVGATRWVAHWVRRTYGPRLGSHAAGVHAGGRATHRVAPTCRACSRVRCSKEHRGRPVACVARGGSRTAPTTPRDVRGTWK
jgi:hypothetical protein